MPDPQHSLRRLQPDFVISPGTQVVVKVAKALPRAEEYRPGGSVGVVVEAPSGNRESYQVRFADGAVVKAYFDELALRRREVEDVVRLKVTTASSVQEQPVQEKHYWLSL